MLDLLLYSTIHCIDAEDLIRRVEANKSVDAIIRTEVIETVKDCLLYTSDAADDMQYERFVRHAVLPAFRFACE